ncbi:hypothetical protein C3L33_07783, partial [Rhododendron williamsianum]
MTGKPNYRVLLRQYDSDDSERNLMIEFGDVAFAMLPFFLGENASPSSKTHDQKLNSPLPASAPPEPLRQLAAASAVFFLGLGISVCSAAAASSRIPTVAVADRPTVVDEQKSQLLLHDLLILVITLHERLLKFLQPDDSTTTYNSFRYYSNFMFSALLVLLFPLMGTMENLEDKDLKATFEKRKSRTYALTVPLRIVALRGSIPPSWVQDFIQSQGRRAKLRLELRGSLNNIFSDLSKSFTEGNIGPKSAVAADIVSVGDSWLSLAIRKGLIVALQGVEDHDWFRGLDDKWKVRIQSDLYGPFYTPTPAV